MMLDVIEQILQSAFAELKASVIQRHEAAGQKASGRTEEAFETLVHENKGELWGADYSPVLQTGRGAGKVPFDFKEILLAWASYKGISFSSQSEANSFAFLVARKIRNEGTALFRSGAMEDIFDTPTNELANTLQQNVANYLQVTIADHIFEPFNKK